MLILTRTSIVDRNEFDQKKRRELGAVGLFAMKKLLLV
jgi:hypothetical protein